MPWTRPAPCTVVLVAVVAVMLGSACSRVQDAADPPKPMTGPEVRRAYFYSRRPYGSEAAFNPLSAFLNNGYDQVRTGEERRFLRFRYDVNATGAWQSMIHPQRFLDIYGGGNWVRNELLPLSGKGEGGGQWVPNYQLHLFAGGVTYVRLIAWYEQRGLSHPRLAAATTFSAFHFLNEMNENGGPRGSIDAMTDLLVFDPAAIVLWNSDRVQRAVGSRVELTEWPGQPTLGLPGETIENTFQTTMLRARLPHSTNWRVFTTMGGSYLGGMSRRAGDSTWWSVGVGGDARTNPVVDTVTGRKTVDLEGNVGLFVDRAGSLLGSLVLKSGFDAAATLNFYPGVLRKRRPTFGLWGQWLRSQELRFGVTSGWGVGLGRNP